jgi:AcrR family transcriptional regulator
MEPTAFSGPAPEPAATSAAPVRAAASGSRVDELLDAAEAVIVRDGIASLTLDAVAAEAKVSKGGLLHHFPNKDRLVEALVMRTARSIREHNASAFESAAEGPGRMVRGLLAATLCDMQDWCTTCQRSSVAAFSALAHNPALIEPMRAAYADLHRRVAEDDLPPGVGDAVVAAIDGMWLYWVLGLMPVDQAMIVRVRKALEAFLESAQAQGKTRKSSSRARGTARRATRTNGRKSTNE